MLFRHAEKSLFATTEIADNGVFYSLSTTLIPTKHSGTMPDPRHVVGGSVWAKSTSVLKDARQIYGVEAEKMCLCGTVMEVLTH